MGHSVILKCQIFLENFQKLLITSSKNRDIKNRHFNCYNDKEKTLNTVKNYKEKKKFE